MLHSNRQESRLHIHGYHGQHRTSSEDLAEIACLAASFARQLELEPRVALLSFANFGSTPHPLADNVRRAVELIRSRHPDFAVDGEMKKCKPIRQ